VAKYPKELRPPPTPKLTRAWDQPKTPAVGDKDPRDTYAAVGSALTEWEQLEHHIGEIFVALVGTNSNEARRAYSAVLTNGMRLKMVGGAGEAFFATRMGDELDNLSKRLKDLITTVGLFADRRNEIAHGIVTVLLDDKNDDSDPTWVLAPSFFSGKNRKIFLLKGSERFGLSPVYQYSSAEIQRLEMHFIALRQIAGRIGVAIRRQRHLERRAAAS
jgi:hypothetical protein